MEMNDIIAADCIENLKQLPEGEPIVITDPPYPNGRDLFEDTWYDGYGALYILCKKAKMIVFFWSLIGVPTPPTGWHEISRHIWHKPNGQSATYYEYVIVWSKEQKQSVSKVWRIPIINYESLREWQPHPTQKPLKLMAELVKMYGKKGDYVLDPFAGSGSTLVACKREGIPFIGFEIEEKYSEIAQRRLSETQKQETLTLNTAVKNAQ